MYRKPPTSYNRGNLSFYTIRFAPERQGKIWHGRENRADKWAVRQIISVEDLDTAIAAGYTEIWQLAEYFDVTEQFMRKAVCLYVHGNIATELYF